MTANVQKPREFTGRHMLVIILAFFGVVIAVNLTMATLASTSWTGLVVENTYVASQQFNKKAEEGRAQAALGWTGKLTIAWGEVRYGLADVAGKPVPL
ncbi:MAG: cytochrome oxidase, partial [Mesorhizobium sp.]